MDDYAEFRHFKYLLAVAEHKGFRAAADALHTSQPSLSRQIRDFQEHYKIRLFRRTRGKGVTLTPAGEALTVIARDVLEMRDYAISALDAIHRGGTDVLRVGCSPFVDKDICRTVSTLHKKLMPSASIHVSSADTKALITELRNGQLDAAIVSLPVDDAELKVELLKQEALVVCLPKDHPLAKKPALSGNDLASHLTVFRDPMQHPEAHERLVELLLELGVRFEEHSHASHPHEMQEAILSGSGFALMRGRNIAHQWIDHTASHRRGMDIRHCLRIPRVKFPNSSGSRKEFAKAIRPKRDKDCGAKEGTTEGPLKSLWSTRESSSDELR